MDEIVLNVSMEQTLLSSKEFPHKPTGEPCEMTFPALND